VRTNVRSEVVLAPIEAGLLRAGAQLFAEHGYHGTGMRDIATAAGVSIGALYHYFPSKEAIFLAVLREGYAQRLEEARALWRGGLAVPEVVQRVVELHFAAVAEGEDLGRLASRPWHGELPGLRTQILALREEYARCIADLLSQARARGEIRSVHPLLTAYALLGLVEAVAARMVAVGDGVAREFRREGPRAVAEIAWRMLRPDKEEAC